jgi:hypothetical protein
MNTARRKLLGMTVLLGSAILAEDILPRSAIAEPEAFKVAMTTLFWVGETSNAQNDFISNKASYWDRNWQASYGGVDEPKHRNGHWPAKFRPKENPFYVALPYGEFTEANKLKREAELIPWFRRGVSPLLKNRWVEIWRMGRSCYAQWQDVGPCNEDDFPFVFGDATKPVNSFGEGAGLDVSPAVWHYLGMRENGRTAWRFVEAGTIPQGPWTEIVTASGNNR